MSGARFLDIVLTVSFFVLGILAIVGVRDFPFADQLFPVTAAILMIACSAIYGIRRILMPPVPDEITGLGTPYSPFTRDEVRSVIAPIMAILALIAGVLIVGHLIAVPLFTFLYIIWKREPLWIALVGAAIMFVFIRVLLIEVMHVAMPYPLLGNWVPF